jgi:hypothetical protein
MTTTKNGVDWPRVLAGIASDRRFRSVGSFLLYAEVEGVRTGVTVATFSPNYKNHALNKPGYKSVVAAKRAKKIDEAFVIEADNSNGSGFTGFADAEELGPRLAALEARSGKFGEFWPLPFSLSPTGGVDEPFALGPEDGVEEPF